MAFYPLLLEQNKYPAPWGGVFISYLTFACAKQVRATATQGELLAPLENPHRLSVPAASRGVIVNLFRRGETAGI